MNEDNNKPQQSSTAPIVLGVIGLIAWLLPLAGFPVTIVGLVLGIKRGSPAGIVLNIIGLVLTAVNSILGAMMFSGKL